MAEHPQVVKRVNAPVREDAFPENTLPGFRVKNRFLVGASEGSTEAEVADSDVYVEVLTCPPGETLSEHRHGHSEVLYVLSGTWQISWRKDSVNGVLEHAILHAGDLAHVPAGWWLTATHDEPCDAELLVIAGKLNGCDVAPWVAEQL